MLHSLALHTDPKPSSALQRMNVPIRNLTLRAADCSIEALKQIDYVFGSLIDCVFKVLKKAVWELDKGNWKMAIVLFVLSMITFAYAMECGLIRMGPQEVTARERTGMLIVEKTARYHLHLPMEHVKAITCQEKGITMNGMPEFGNTLDPCLPVSNQKCTIFIDDALQDESFRYHAVQDYNALEDRGLIAPIMPPAGGPFSIKDYIGTPIDNVPKIKGTEGAFFGSTDKYAVSTTTSFELASKFVYKDGEQVLIPGENSGSFPADVASQKDEL